MPKRAVVFGAIGGIGSACVSVMADAGWDVLATDLERPELEPPCTPFALDVTDLPSVRVFAEAAGPVQAVIYAAGIVATTPIADTDFAVWRQIMAVNLDGAAHVAQAFSASMIAQRNGGAFVFISSAAGVKGEAGATAYCASKAGLIGLTESMAAELSPNNIRVNAVAPGNVDTPMLRKVAREIARNTGENEADIWAGFSRKGAAQRLVTPREVAQVCSALCSTEFMAVTGATVPVDTGYLLS